MTHGKRPKITAITLHVLMPDGTTQIRTIDPVQSDALFWSDRSIKVLAGFYEKGGPAAGKRVTAEHLRKFFGPEAEKLAGGAEDVEITPDLVKALWNTPKDEGHAPAYLCKSLANHTNG